MAFGITNDNPKPDDTRNIKDIDDFKAVVEAWVEHGWLTRIDGVITMTEKGKQWRIDHPEKPLGDRYYE